ncbi:MAG: Gmad2 immunoglobulin-like domain-containing protein [Candidatus Paceibacterota bacterium]|jgi:hypothetical protein
MTNFGKLLLVIVVVVALGGTVYFLNKKTTEPVVNDVSIPTAEDNVIITDDSVNINQDTVNTNTPNKPSTSTKPIANVSVLGNKSDLVSFSIPVGSIVTGVVQANGSVRGGYFFEGNIIVRILDSSKSVLRTTYGTATSAWMTIDPVTFNTTLDFTGLVAGPGYIELHNDNASGLPENDKSILIPVVIQ